MEDLNELYKLLERADAAGDEESVITLIPYIKQVEAAVASQSTEESTEEQPVTAKQPDLTQAPKVIPQQKPEDVGFLDRAKESLKEGLTSFGGIKRGYELGSAKDRGDLAAAATKMQEIKTRAEQPVTPTLTAADINRIAHEKGLLPAGAQVPSYIVEQVLKSGPEMAVPILTSLLVGTGTAMVSGPFAPVAAPIAAAAAGIGTYGLQQYGHFMETQGLVKKAPEDLDPNQARVWAAITAPIGFIVDKFVAGVGSKFGQKAMLSKITEEIAKRKAAGEGVKTAIAKEVGKAAGVGVAKGVTEMPTEMFEQAVEIIQAGGDITTEESKRQLFEAGWAGLAVGSSLGSAANAYSKYKEFKTEQQQQQQEAEPIPTTEKRPSRETLKRQFLKDAEEKANEINRVKAEEAAKLKAAQNQQVISEAADLETTLPDDTNVITPTTLTSWGIKKNSNAFKVLNGVDASTPEGRDLVDKTLEAYTGKLNEDAIDTFTSLLDQQKAEAPDAGFNLGTATISDEVLGGQKYGTPGGAQGRYGPTTDISGSVAGIDQTGTTDVNAPLRDENGFITNSEGTRYLVFQHKRGSNYLHPEQDIGAFAVINKGQKGSTVQDLNLVLNKEGKLVPAGQVLTNNESNGTAFVPESEEQAAIIMNLLEQRATTAVGSNERKVIDEQLVKVVKGKETKPLETIKGPEARAKAPTLKGGERLLSIQELLNDPNPQQRRAARRSFMDWFKTQETNELIKEGAKLEREERAKFANLKKTQYPIVDQSTNLANILSTLKDKPNYLIEDLRNPDVPDAERQELNQHARDYLLAESLRNKYKVRMTPEEVAALEKEGETITRKEKPLSEDEFKDLQEEYLARQTREEGPLEARGEIQNTGETPESIEGAFQKQYGKNVGLAKRRGLLQFLTDVSQLPPEVGPVSPGTKAVYHKGVGYFITNRITKEDAPRMLLHEIGVHYGLEGMLGTANYKRVVKQIKQKHLTDKELKAAWDNTIETYPEYAEGSDNFMQEVIAKIGETAPNNTIWRQIVGYIKQFLSKLGYGWDVNKITVDDIRDMVQQSVRMSLAGKIKGVEPDLAMASEETGEPKPTYYSQLSRVITNAQFKNNVSTQSGEQWVNWLNSKTSEAGVKRDELEFSGLLEFLDRNKSEKFNKQDILNYLKQNGTKVNEYMYGEGEGNSYSDKDKEEWVEQGVSEWVAFEEEGLALKVNEEATDTYEFPYYVKEEEVTDAEGNKLWRIYYEGQRSAVEDTYYSSEDEARDVADEYNNQGLNELAELLYERYTDAIYSKAEDVREELADQWDEDHDNARTRYLDWTLEGGDKKYTEVVIALEDPREKVLFSHDHWRDLSNPIAHYRVNARLDTKGSNVLFVEEIQSDWAQAPKKLRKKHITELAEKFKVANNSPLPLDTIKKQIAKFVPGDWGFQRKVTPEQQKEYDEILTKLKDFREAKAKLSDQIYKFSEFEKRLFDYIDYEARKILYSKIASNTNISEDLTPEEKAKVKDSLLSRHKHEFDLTRRAYLKRVLNQDVRSGYRVNGFAIDENIIKEILNQPGVKENIAQYEKNKTAQDKAIYQEDQLYDKIKDLESKQQALSQTGKFVRAPFVEDTESWSNLVLKNIIRFAAERGYDKVAFVNGKQAAFKGGRAERIDEVFGTRNADNTFTIYATLKDGGGRSRTLENIRDLDLEDYIGGLADKMRSLEVGETDGWDAGDMKLPAQGMVEFYDHYIPRYAAKLIKKLGGTQLETIELIPPNQDSPEDEKVGKQKGFTITSVMKEKAMAGQPLFARASKQQLDEDLKKSNTVGKEEKGFPTLGERFAEAPLKTTDELIADFRKSFFSFDAAINNKILIAMRQQGMSNQEVAKMIQESRVSQAVKADQIADMWMVHGGIEYDPESFSFVIKDLTNSMSTIRDTLKTLAKKYKVSEYEMYQYGHAAFVSSRSADLIKQNQKLYKRIVALYASGKTAAAKKAAEGYKLVNQTPAEIKRGLKFFDSIPELKKLKKVWNINRSRLMDVAVENGLYTREQAEELLDVIDYVPFFRDKQVEAGKALKEYPRGLLDVATQKHLKGSYQPVHNVFDNMERWARYTLKKSINNKAAQEKIKYYSKYLPDDIKVLKAGRSATGNTVGIWQEGKVVKYEFQGYDGESMVDGFTGMEPATMAPGAAFTRPFNEFLRAQIVLEPLFNLAQIPMDMFNAMFSSGVNVSIAVPLQVVKEIIFTPLGISSARKYLTARGITGKRDFNSEYDRIDINGMKEVKELSKTGKLIEYILAPPKALLKGAKFLGMVSDNIIRQAVYSQILLETGDKARATYAADEIINFRRTGSSSAVNLVRQNAVFINANLQAMNISYGTIMLSDITNDRKLIQLRRLLLNGAQVIMAGLALVAINADDDDYKKTDPKDRDNAIMLPGTGGYKLPLRGDILTFIFKVLPEHLYNRYIEESEDSEKMKKALSVAFQRALTMPSPIPSYLTFFIEQGLNFDFVTGRPLKGRSQEDLEADLQYSNKYTSQFARAVTDLTKDKWYEVTPIGVQHFMNRWLASTSMLVGLFTNSIIANMRGEILPTQTIREKLLQIPNMGRFLSKEENTRNINDFYELSQLIDAAVQSANRYKSFDMDKYKEFLAKDNKAALINLRKELAIIKRDLSNIREYENRIYASKDTGKWTPQTKKDELMRLEALRQKILGHEQQVKDGTDRYIQNMRKAGGL